MSDEREQQVAGKNPELSDEEKKKAIQEQGVNVVQRLLAAQKAVQEGLGQYTRHAREAKKRRITLQSALFNNLYAFADAANEHQAMVNAALASRLQAFQASLEVFDRILQQSGLFGTPEEFDARCEEVAQQILEERKKKAEEESEAQENAQKEAASRAVEAAKAARAEDAEAAGGEQPAEPDPKIIRLP